MHVQINIKEDIIKELDDVPMENMPKILEMVHSLKKCKKKTKKKRDKDTLYELVNITVETGIKDLAENHDYYLYGVRK